MISCESASLLWAPGPLKNPATSQFEFLRNQGAQLVMTRPRRKTMRAVTVTPVLNETSSGGGSSEKLAPEGCCE